MRRGISKRIYGDAPVFNLTDSAAAWFRGLRPRLPGARVAPETVLDLRHEACRTERPADRLAPSQADEGGGVRFALEPVGEMRRAVEKRPDADEPVVAPGEMRA